MIKLFVLKMSDTDIYCMKCRKVTITRNPKVQYLQFVTPNGKRAKRLSLNGTCTICGTKKVKFVNDHVGRGLLSMLGIKTPLAKIPIIGQILG